jgi:hypothetical protein
MSMVRLTLECRNCGRGVSQEVDEPLFHFGEKESDRRRGVSVEKVPCENCGAIHAIRLENFGVATAAVDLDRPQAIVEVSDDLTSEFERWIEETPVFPERTYQRAIRDLNDFEKIATVSMKLEPAFIRMLFTQYFSALEAYLSGRLIRLISGNKESLIALIKQHKELQNEKIDYATALEDPGAIERKVVLRLKEMVWHQFTKVDHLYIGCLGSSIFPSPEIRAFLMEQCSIRHHCVHRNGRDLDDNLVSIGWDDLRLLRDNFNSVFDTIEAAVAVYMGSVTQKIRTRRQLIEALTNPSRE